ncbi:unnamed protein product [Larinioides sclopetarius]|uniref:Uncharacterized protein n=1 Tax=Larinioides sclopetarius TaxID=280406 RepID=A0AAV2ARY1_9ARAC
MMVVVLDLLKLILYLEVRTFQPYENKRILTT